MKSQDFFSSKDKSKKLKCRLLQFLFGALRVYVRIERFDCMVLFSNTLENPSCFKLS